MINLKHSGGIFDLDKKIKQIGILEAQQQDPATWTARSLSQSIGKEKRALETVVSQAEFLTNQLKDNQELFELALIENDTEPLEMIQLDTERL